MVSSNVVVVGTSKKGKPLYGIKPTKTDVAREESAQRQQVFRGGTKISDTARVEVMVGGEKKFVTPERALDLTSNQEKREEAKRKIKRSEELKQTIRKRLQPKEEPEPEMGRKLVSIAREPNATAPKKKTKTLVEEREEAAKSPIIFPAVIAAKDIVREAKRKEAILETPQLFPELFGLARKTFVGEKSSKVTIEQTIFGPREKIEPTIVGRPKEVTQFTQTGLLTLPQVRTKTKAERFKERVEESFSKSTFGSGLKEISGQFAVAGGTLIAKPLVKAVIEPLPSRIKEPIKEASPSEETIRVTGEEGISKGVSETAYRLGTVKGATSTALTVATFTAGVGLVGTLAKGTKFVKPVAAVIKYSPDIFVGALAGGKIISGGFRVAAGEEPLVAIGKEAGTFGGELLGFGVVAGGLGLGLTGAKKLIPRKFTKVKLSGLRERTVIGKGGEVETSFEADTILGRTYKSRKTPKIKPIKLGFKETKEIKIPSGDSTKVLVGERYGIAEVSFPGGIAPKKGAKPKVTIKKVTAVNIQEPILLLGQEPTFGTTEFVKRPAIQKFTNVKGFDRIDIRKSDLIILGKGKPQTFPFITSKEVKVKPSVRKGSLITQNIFQAEKVEGLEPIGFKETDFFFLQPKQRVSKPKLIIGQPPEIIPPRERIIDLTSGKKKEFVKIDITKRKFDIGELKFKDVVSSKFIETAPPIPKARRIALERITGSSQVAESISVPTKVSVSKPTIGVIKQPSKLSFALTSVGKNLVFVAPPSQVSKGKRLPQAGILTGTSREFDIQMTPMSGIKPISDVTRIPRQISEPQLIPDLARIREPTVDIIRTPDTDIIRGVDIINIQSQITDFPRPRPKPRPGFPDVPPFVPGRGLFFPPIDFFGGTRIYKGKGRQKQKFAFTPDFISSVTNEFGPAPKQRRFTGQERRFKVKGRKFISKLPNVPDEGIFGLIRRQLRL